MHRIRLTSACLALTLFLALPMAAQASPADGFVGPGLFDRLWSRVIEWIEILLPGGSSAGPQAAIEASGLGADPNGTPAPPPPPPSGLGADPNG